MSPKENDILFEELIPVIEFALDRPLPELNIDTHLYEEEEMDSMGAVAMVVEIQRSFGIRIPDERVQHLRTPRQWLEEINIMLSNSLECE